MYFLSILYTFNVFLLYLCYKHYVYMEIRIKELCQQHGTTQKELAVKLGVSEMTLSRAVKGNTSLSLLEKIACGLGVEVSELFTPKSNTIICPKCGAVLEVKERE